MTYRQVNIMPQVDGSPWTSVFLISDTYDGLLAEVFTYVNIFTLGDCTEKVNDSDKYIESELKITVDQSMSKNSYDDEATQFIVDAINPLNNRYCALYYCKENELSDITNRVFYGIVQSEHQDKDVHHFCEDWADNLNALKVYEFKANPIQKSVFEAIKTSEIIDAIDQEWIDENVKNVKGGYYFNTSTNSYLVINSIVSLNKLLRKLTDNFVNALLVKNISVDISFEGNVLPYKILPVRWSKTEILPNPLARPNGAKEPSWYVHYQTSEQSKHVVENLYTNITDEPFRTFVEEAKQLTLSPDDSKFINASEDDIYIDFKVVKKYASEYEYNEEQAKNLRINQIDNFIDLLIAISQNYNLYFSMNYTNANAITLKFTAPSAMTNPKIFVKYLTQCDADASSETDSDEIYGEGIAFYGVKEGNNSYQLQYGTAKQDDVSNDKTSTETGKRQLINTISPTLKRADKRMDFGQYREIPVSCFMPHNHAVAVNNDENVYTDKERNAFSLHTAIYTYVAKTILTATPQFDNYYTPVAAIVCEIDGEERMFTKMSDYLNAVRERENSYAKYERTIEVPGYNVFSLSANGSNPSWKNVKLGSTLKIDGIDYSITERTFNNTKPIVKLKAQAIVKFSGQSVPEVVTKTYIPNIKDITYDEDNEEKLEQDEIIVEADKDVETVGSNYYLGNILMLWEYGENNTLAASPAEEFSEWYNYRLGYCTKAFVDNGISYVKLKLRNIVTVVETSKIQNWNTITKGTKLYLRVETESETSLDIVNIKSEVLKNRYVNERPRDVVIEIGEKFSDTELMLEFKYLYVLKD